MIDLRETPAAAHPRPGRLPGVRLRLVGRPGAIWVADREPPLPHGYTSVDDRVAS